MRSAAALARNQAPLLERFLEAGGAAAVEKLFTDAAAPIRLRARAMELLADLAPQDERVKAQLQTESSCRGIVALLRQADRDVQVGGPLPLHGVLCLRGCTDASLGPRSGSSSGAARGVVRRFWASVGIVVSHTRAPY